MKVQNMTGHNGNTVPNQFIIKDYRLNTVYFQSYNSIIIKKEQSLKTDDRIYLDVNKWDYSSTTSKYRNRFLGMTTTEIKTKIKSGEIMLVDLNK